MKKTEIRYLEQCDKKIWFSFDKHLSDEEFDKKVRDRLGYVLLCDGKIVGILRYNLFWDNTPFCTLIYIDEAHRGNGYGKKLMTFWESEMKLSGYGYVLVSTQSDEDAQRFYRASGYTDCGVLLAPNQAAELFLIKNLP